jgi:hypothetical protein
MEGHGAAPRHGAGQSEVVLVAGPNEQLKNKVVVPRKLNPPISPDLSTSTPPPPPAFVDCVFFSSVLSHRLCSDT